MISRTRISTLATLLVLGACNLDPKNLSDTSDSASESTGQTSQATDDGATGEPMSTSQTSDPGTTAGITTTDSGEGGSTAVDDGGEGGSTAVDTGDTESPVEVMCFGDLPTFPAFERQCQSDADCTFVLHTVDCCGSERAYGIEKDEVDAFDEAEAICDMQYPRCDCLPMPTIADDGNATTDPQQLASKCNFGYCESFVDDPCAGVELPPCPGECPPGDFCGMACEVEGSKCGNNIGDGMECIDGTWMCTVHPPLGPGCNLVCK